MTTTFDVTGRDVIVVGAGRSGIAAAELLHARGAHVLVADSADQVAARPALEAAGVDVVTGPHPTGRFRSADLIVLSPGVPPTEPAVAAAREAGVPIIGEVELASRWLRGRIIAITGTKGKSTTTTLVARMLAEGGISATAGGNLGVALSSIVEQSTPDAIHVVEVSSFQLETIDTFRPWIAVLLNLSPDHLDRHASFEEYGRAKARVFENQTAEDWAVVNADESGLDSITLTVRARRFEFAVERQVGEGVGVADGFIVEYRRGTVRRVMHVEAVQVPGRHLFADVLAATAVALLAGVAPEAIERAVRGYRGIEHALELVVETGGVRFVNDSKATNVVSARRAIESFDRGVVPILGGHYKGGAFEDLREVVSSRASALVVIGEAADRITAALSGLVPIERASSMDDAVERAYRAASPGGVVLLAPACSSFDMFADYAERGRAFRAAARNLAARVAAGKG
jgi:UDP-N-acetylmuramoylalanine--D-glutamate ligase